MDLDEIADRFDDPDEWNYTRQWFERPAPIEDDLVRIRRFYAKLRRAMRKKQPPPKYRKSPKRTY
jgi:hypothetical protein